MKSTDPIYLGMREIVWSNEGTMAAIEACEAGRPALCGIDPLVRAKFGNDYRSRDGPMNLGFLVAERMRGLGYAEAGTGPCGDGCIARSGLLWVPKEKHDDAAEAHADDAGPVGDERQTASRATVEELRRVVVERPTGSARDGDKRKRARMTAKSSTTAYGWVPVTIHWLTAILVIGLIVSGLTSTSLPAEAKAQILSVHAPIGTLVLILTLLRIAWWLFLDKKPPPVEGAPGATEFAARAVHLLFYVAILGLAGSGISLLLISGAGQVLQTGEGVIPDLWQFPARIAHRVFAWSMIALVTLHVAAALWHHFVRRDRTLMRMLGVG